MEQQRQKKIKCLLVSEQRRYIYICMNREDGNLAYNCTNPKPRCSVEPDDI